MSWEASCWNLYKITDNCWSLIIEASVTVAQLKTTDRSGVMSALNLKLKFRMNTLDSLWAVGQWWGAITSHLNHAPLIKQFVTQMHSLFLLMYLVCIWHIHLFSIFIDVCSIHGYFIKNMWKSEGNLWKLSFSFYYVSTRIKCVVRLGGMLPHSLSRLPSPVNAFLNVC